MTTTYLSVESESWVPPAPPWLLGLVTNVRRNLPFCTSSPTDPDESPEQGLAVASSSLEEVASVVVGDRIFGLRRVEQA